jgi:hypothetical protein
MRNRDPYVFGFRSIWVRDDSAGGVVRAGVSPSCSELEGGSDKGFDLVKGARTRYILRKAGVIAAGRHEGDHGAIVAQGQGDLAPCALPAGKCDDDIRAEDVEMIPGERRLALVPQLIEMSEDSELDPFVGIAVLGIRVAGTSGRNDPNDEAAPRAATSECPGHLAHDSRSCPGEQVDGKGGEPRAERDGEFGMAFLGGPHDPHDGETSSQRKLSLHVEGRRCLMARALRGAPWGSRLAGPRRVSRGTQPPGLSGMSRRNPEGIRQGVNRRRVRRRCRLPARPGG